MKIYDISVQLDENTPVWPGDPKIKLETTSSRKNGDDYHVSKFLLGAHNGTHIDAPYHFLEQGAKLSEINLSNFFTKTRVIEYPARHHISRNFLETISLNGLTSLLFKTSNSRWLGKTDEPFRKNFIALTTSAANWLVENGMKLIGIDYFSIEPFRSKKHEVHKILLSKNVIILEGIHLTAVPPGEYQLICFPLKIDAPDGAPVRAILLKK